MRTLMIALAGLALAASPAHAGLSGAAGTAAYYYPDLATPYAQASTPAPFVIGAGEEAAINVENVTTIHLDFSNTALDVLFNTVLNNPTWTGSTFNGVVFTSPAFATLTGVTVDPASTFAGFDASRVSFSGSEMRINWGGLGYVDGMTLGLDFAFSTVPEPATWALLLTGFGAVGIAARRRRFAAA